MNLELHISSLRASYARARAKVSIRVEGRLNNNSWQIPGFKSVIKKTDKEGVGTREPDPTRLADPNQKPEDARPKPLIKSL